MSPKSQEEDRMKARDHSIECKGHHCMNCGDCLPWECADYKEHPRTAFRDRFCGKCRLEYGDKKKAQKKGLKP
jgi:hypothetical protein